ncbi:MAG TPA: ABATE domain-containing protein [Solirubrobacterales bacterium]|jgi:predicted RNA-binding Zn ribbon-like protein
MTKAITKPTPRPERQPGHRTPAPGDLRVVQSFVNTSWDLDHQAVEQLQSPGDLAAWLAEHGLLESGAKLTAADLERALDVRQGLRALLFANNGAAPDGEAIERLNRALGETHLSVRFDPDATPELGARGRGLDAALGSLSSIVAVAQVEGTWSRLKACRGVHCGWAFYDNSRNRSGSWCSMSVCGSRSKAREYRRRQRS